MINYKEEEEEEKENYALTIDLSNEDGDEN